MCILYSSGKQKVILLGKINFAKCKPGVGDFSLANDSGTIVKAERNSLEENRFSTVIYHIPKGLMLLVSHCGQLI